MTAAAKKRLEGEIAELEGAGRREKAERIGVAREWGDLKENSEYHDAKNDAALLEAKIARLREQLRTAEIVPEEHGQEAGMGSTVTYVDESNGREMRFKLVPGIDAKPADGLLSIDSPVGRALTGAKAGETRTLQSPKGPRTTRVLTVDQP
jgi:transcription elongation factor GreA